MMTELFYKNPNTTVYFLNKILGSNQFLNTSVDIVNDDYLMIFDNKGNEKILSLVIKDKESFINKYKKEHKDYKSGINAITIIKEFYNQYLDDYKVIFDKKEKTFKLKTR
jgi:hypothetical protein